MSAPAFRLQSGPIALYVQIATLLRDRIKDGEWPHAHDLPSIEELCVQYGVARITVRQALQMLASEGLIASQRGRRAFVTYDSSRPGVGPLYTTLEPTLQMAPDHEIVVLDEGEAADLPESGRFYGTPCGPYARIRKIHREGGTPYCWTEIFIERALYRRFPPGAVHQAKLALLMRDHAEPPVDSGRERLTVAAATVEEARLLDYPVAAPVARVRRIFCDEDNRTLYFGASVYRGDRFGSERDLTSYVKHVW